MDQRKKILIVDDESRNQRIMQEILEEHFDLITASNGQEALALNGIQKPDLILLDIMMPGLDGYEVCRKIREDPQYQFTKIIFLSGKAMMDQRLKGYEVGGDDYLAKPFVAEELLSKAKVFLRLNTIEKELGDLHQSLENQVIERSQKLLEAEARLMSSARLAALGEMAGGIAHEVNTPLGVIMLLVSPFEQGPEQLSERLPLPQTTLIDMLDNIDSTVQRINAIINGLKAFSRNDSPEEMTLVPLQTIFEETLPLCNMKLKQNNIELRMESIPADLMIRCRPVQIYQVLLNLINNSCDAVSLLTSKWIQISVERKLQQVRILVTDSGSGLPEEIRHRIFQPFYTTKEIGKGTGLGLSISKGIMESHSGSLTLDATCENTRFIMTLPSRELE